MSATTGDPRVRWGIVGTGWMSSGIATAIRAQPDAELVAVASRSAQRGAAFSERFGRPAVDSDLEALLARRSIDAVYIGSPNSLHAEQALLAARSGRHVLCDKPLALDSASAQAVVAAAAQAEVVLSLNLQTRHHPAVGMIRAAIEAGTIGRPEWLSVRLSFGFEELVGWRADPALAGGGCLMNLGVHALDMLAVLAGRPVTTVMAMSTALEHGFDRTTEVLARFDDGALGHAYMSQGLGREDVVADIRGTLGSIRWEGWLAPYREGDLVVSTAEGEVRRPVAAPDAYSRMLAAFQRAITGGAAPDPTPSECLDLVRVTEAVARSARDGLAVEIERPEPG